MRKLLRARIPKVFIKYRLGFILASQILLFIFSYYASFLLRFDLRLEPSYRLAFYLTLPIILLVKIPAFYCVGLFRGWWRYVGVSDVLNISKASLISSGVVYFCVKLVFPAVPFPRSVLGIDFMLSILLIGGARFAVRIYTESARSHPAERRTLIVGAGQAGNKIASELKRNPDLDLNPLGFIDDEATKKNIRIQGIKVIGTTQDLPRLIEQKQIDCVLVAIPSATRAQIQNIVDKCSESKVELKILRGIAERINRLSVVSQLRSVRLEDLLGREPVMLDLPNIRQRFAGKVVFITGAGGSIGSELVRQLAQFKPKKLVLFERSENDLHKINVALSSKALFPIVGDILDVSLLRQVFGDHRPDSVFHAAAYKHVPMMERNCFQAVINNVFGTYNTALVARQYEVADFVMISSDKAVNPTSMMGVTKRVAELVILGLQHQHTRFTSVRFGNVLGSNGSVVPLFEQQIASGGPITITHPDAKRYFMTIPEAVQLVLQASIMGKGGEIFLLDMGEPVKIIDLAKNLIRLSGLDVDHDIEIVYTGLRPGEKLFEELKLQGEGIKPTLHKKIRVLDGGQADFRQVRRWLDELSAAVEARNVHGLIQKLQAIVPEYSPSEELLSLCELDRHDLALAYKGARRSLALAAGD